MPFNATNVNCHVSCTLIKTICPHFGANPLQKVNFRLAYFAQKRFSLVNPAFIMSVLSRLPYSQREIRPLDKWEILPEQIEIEEELGRGAFGMVYKATFRKRVGMEVFDTEITKRTLLSDKKPPQVVAVKGLHGKKYCSLTKDKGTKAVKGTPNYPFLRENKSHQFVLLK